MKAKIKTKGKLLIENLKRYKGELNANFFLIKECVIWQALM